MLGYEFHLGRGLGVGSTLRLLTRLHLTKEMRNAVDSKTASLTRTQEGDPTRPRGLTSIGYLAVPRGNCACTDTCVSLCAHPKHVLAMTDPST